ncbi:uncharacterized protein C9orf85 homolog [Bombina bombina]|uniref:uncharacterized protein C9orf85 homolog n=1 Tax=Bombina bombina TaxID=8345 RepID=UPI00235A943A|nr:uncharacterized protein C9orf85 homolog [Bombina bombina]
MSSQKGNVYRSRPQKHKNVTSFKNDKYNSSSSRIKKINSKLHDGVCQRCKEVLEWKVKYSKYKPLSQPKKCVKCLQKTVKDSYHIICKPCAVKLDICAKCGKNEEIVLPITKESQAPPTESPAPDSENNEGEDSENNEEDDLDFKIDMHSSDEEFTEDQTSKKKMCQQKCKK